MMASAALPLPSAVTSHSSRPWRQTPGKQILRTGLSASPRCVSGRKNSGSRSPSIFRPPALRRRWRVEAAYVSAPASDPNIGGSGNGASPGAPALKSEAARAPPAMISQGVMLGLLARHKLRIAVSLLALIGCTTCTLSMPIFSGKFFEVLVGTRPESLLEILSKIAVVYVMEPIFTVIFVVNMATIWEKVMASLRAQVFRRMLIQKVEFFDRYKVGELTGLLTSDLGSLKDVVSENISRDRGLRALSEIVGTICILFSLSVQLAPVLAVLMLSVSVLVAIFKRSTIPIFKSHGSAQARIADCATETFSAIRTVRSFAGEKRQMSMFASLVLAYQNSGTKLGILKSANESLTRVVVYISLMALYFLGGNKVKAVKTSILTSISLISIFQVLQRCIVECYLCIPEKSMILLGLKGCMGVGGIRESVGH